MDADIKYLLDSKGCYARGDINEVQKSLHRLGVHPDQKFIDFFLEFEGPFSNFHNTIVLADLTVGESESIENMTFYLREHHGFDSHFLVLSSIDGGDSAIVYDCKTNTIYHIDFEGTDKLLKNGELVPHWNSFEEFLREYFWGRLN